MRSQPKPRNEGGNSIEPKDAMRARDTRRSLVWDEESRENLPTRDTRERSTARVVLGNPSYGDRPPSQWKGAPSKGRWGARNEAIHGRTPRRSLQLSSTRKQQT